MDNVLNWDARYKIAVGAARGISYLHHDCIPHIIHRDIKSSNILLDENMEARVSDFGLATLMEKDKTHVSTLVAGTFGYLAPGKVLLIRRVLGMGQNGFRLKQVFLVWAKKCQVGLTC